MTARPLFEPGDRIGPYEIQGRLRAGGMATLFLGRRHGAAGVSRTVVIKVIHPHLAEDDLIVNMFIDEARISSKISHSNVVYVEQFGEHEGVYYMVWSTSTAAPSSSSARRSRRLANGSHPSSQCTSRSRPPPGFTPRTRRSAMMARRSASCIATSATRTSC
jgi:hypothetical protein